MNWTPDGNSPEAGLRERKKAKTRAAIQQHALRLFRDQGYQATTVEQIAEAAEVAPSTVFRYFPTKEDLAALGEHYSFAPRIAGAFREQPPEASVSQALRGAIRSAFDDLDPAERAARNERDLLMVTVPELWAANLDLITEGMDVLSALVAERVGRDSGDPAVRAFTGAVLGVALTMLLDAAKDPNPHLDHAEALDDALAHLDAGLALSDPPTL